MRGRLPWSVCSWVKKVSFTVAEVKKNSLGQSAHSLVIILATSSISGSWVLAEMNIGVLM